MANYTSLFKAAGPVMSVIYIGIESCNIYQASKINVEEEEINAE
jgi:hypothetical protein